MEYSQQYKENQGMVEDYLRTCFDGRIAYADLYDAMNYSLLGGGKRIRPILALEACRLCGGDVKAVLPLACAVELVHTYSLIHDDLPCMDDDDLRRGRPTNHKVYGEATAVLAGDGLLTAAFELISSCDTLSAEQIVAAVKALSYGAGPSGMVGGQVLDMAGEGRPLHIDDLKELQQLKTGALIRAALAMGCIGANASDEEREKLCNYADYLGLAFQIQDDILDVEGDEAALGKPIGSDAASNKTTFVTLKGLDDCKALVQKLTDQAVAQLDGWDGSEFLCTLAQSLANRNQ